MQANQWSSHKKSETKIVNDVTLYQKNKMKWKETEIFQVLKFEWLGKLKGIELLIMNARVRLVVIITKNIDRNHNNNGHFEHLNIFVYDWIWAYELDWYSMNESDFLF